MPAEKPSGLPEAPPDPALFGVPTNAPPSIAWPDPIPEDPARERVVSEGATHIVLANRFDQFARGDKISQYDLPEAADLEAIEKIKPYPPIRPLNNDEKPKADEVTKHRKAKAKAPAAVVPAPGAVPPPPVALEHPPK